MSLSVYVPDKNPKTGLSGDDVKPITEGVKVDVVREKSIIDRGFELLDEVQTTAGNALSDYVSQWSNREISRLNLGAEASPTTTGNPNDNPGRVQAAPEKSFVDKYKKELMIAGGVLAAGAVYFAIKR